MGIRKLREARGITQKFLAKVLGVDVNTLWRWENGSRVPSHRNAQKIAEYFSCSLEDVYANPTPPPTKTVCETGARLTEAARAAV